MIRDEKTCKIIGAAMVDDGETSEDGREKNKQN
jgi:hypothetical protein